MKKKKKKKKNLVAQTQLFCYFLKFVSLVFLEITYSDSLRECLTSSRGKIHKKKFLIPNLGRRGQNQSQNQVSCHFFKFGSLDFLEIAYNYSLQQCITSSRAKTHKKSFGTKFGPKQAKFQPDTRFSTIFSSLVHWFSLKLHTMIACSNF